MLRKALAAVCLLIGLILLNGGFLEWYGLHHRNGWQIPPPLSEQLAIVSWTGPFALAFLAFSALLWWTRSLWVTWSAGLACLLALTAVLAYLYEDLDTYLFYDDRDFYAQFAWANLHGGNGLYDYSPLRDPISPSMNPIDISDVQRNWYGYSDLIGPAVYLLLPLGLVLCVVETWRARRHSQAS